MHKCLPSWCNSSKDTCPVEEAVPSGGEGNEQPCSGDGDKHKGLVFESPRLVCGDTRRADFLKTAYAMTAAGGLGAPRLFPRQPSAALGRRGAAASGDRPEGRALGDAGPGSQGRQGEVKQLESTQRWPLGARGALSLDRVAH